jgi:putative copper resistance protein D
LHQLHIWAWYPNPSGLFAGTNPLLAPYGGVQGVAGGATGHGSTKRSPAQIAFSEFNHNSSGALLIVIGIAAVMEVFLPGRPWTRSLWPLTAIGTSLYIIIRSDPRVWPMGSIPLWEGLNIPSVWQHKTGGLILLAIGLIEFLRRRGRLRHPVWGYLFPCLALAGGAMLLLLHGGHSAGLILAFISQQLLWGLAGFKIYLQHAAMGILALLLGGTKLLWDHHPEKRNRPLVWRVVMILFGLLLLFYSET